MGICEPALKQICKQLRYAISLKSILLSRNPGITETFLTKICEYLNARIEPPHRVIKAFTPSVEHVDKLHQRNITASKRMMRLGFVQTQDSLVISRKMGLFTTT